MNTKLLDIQPSELKFIFELKKQSSCSVQLTNNTNHYVAFKVKTTSPKKYCVRPNVGVVMPKSTCNFSVTMQAQLVAPPDMVCKDKFLIQSTVVPVGTTNEDITPGTFSKDHGKYIEEVKLRVALISPPHSPPLSPINGTLEQELVHESSILKGPLMGRPGIFNTPYMVAKDVESKNFNDEKIKPATDAEPKLKKDSVNVEEVKSATDVELKPERSILNFDEIKSTKDAELKPQKDVVRTEELNIAKHMINDDKLKIEKHEENTTIMNGETERVRSAEELKLVKDIDDMKSKLHELESKLAEAEGTISRLTEESKLSSQDKKILQEEVAALRIKSSVRKVQVGFPLLFVCMVALISIVIGYLSHP